MLPCLSPLRIRPPPVDGCEYSQASWQVPASLRSDFIHITSERTIHFAGIHSKLSRRFQDFWERRSDAIRAA
jgi:hypothetical protein